MTVRMATRRDEPAIAAVLMGPDGLHSDNTMGIAFDRAKVERRIKTGTRARGGIIGIVDAPDGVAATVGLFLDAAWYSETPYLAELWLFCRPVYRGRGYEAELFEFAKSCRAALAKGSGEPFWLLTSVVSRKRLPAKMRLWARHAHLIGGIYVEGDGELR